MSRRLVASSCKSTLPESVPMTAIFLYLEVSQQMIELVDVDVYTAELSPNWFSGK